MHPLQTILQLRSRLQRFVLTARYTGVRIDRSALVRLDKVRGLRSASCLEVGADTTSHATFCYDRPEAVIRLGQRCFVGASTFVAAEQIVVEDDVMISWGATIVDHNSHSARFSERQHDVLQWRAGKKDWRYVKIAPVHIKSKAWIGFNALVLKGVTIGEGAVVGAGAVITRDVPDWTVVAGNPARVIKEIGPDER